MPWVWSLTCVVAPPFSVFHIGLPSFKCHISGAVRTLGAWWCGHYRWQEMLQVHDVERLLGKLWWQSWVPVLCSSLTDALTTGHKSFFPHFSFLLLHSSDTYAAFYWSHVCCFFAPFTVFRIWPAIVRCYEVCTYSYSPWSEALLLRIRYIYVRQQCSKQCQLVTSSHMYWKPFGENRLGNQPKSIFVLHLSFFFLLTSHNV